MLDLSTLATAVVKKKGRAGVSFAKDVAFNDTVAWGWALLLPHAIFYPGVLLLVGLTSDFTITNITSVCVRQTMLGLGIQPVL